MKTIAAVIAAVAALAAAATFAADIQFFRSLDMNDNIIKRVGAPVEPTDAASKAYVDSATNVFGAKIDYLIWVSKNGDDTTGNGSIVRPFKTIQVAVDAADGVNRTVIMIPAGTWNESVVCTKDMVFLYGIGGLNATYLQGNPALTVRPPDNTKKFNEFHAYGLFLIDTVSDANPAVLLDGSILRGTSLAFMGNEALFTHCGFVGKGSYALKADNAVAVSLQDSWSAGGGLELHECSLFATYNELRGPIVLEFDPSTLPSSSQYGSEMIYCDMRDGGTVTLGSEASLFALGCFLDGNVTLDDSAELDMRGGMVSGTITHNSSKTVSLKSVGVQQTAGAGAFDIANPAKYVTYDNAESGLEAHDTQAAIDELNGKIGGGANTFVQKAGDTMTGALTLPGDPASVLHAAPKQYVDTAADTAKNAAISTAAADATTKADAARAAAEDYADEADKAKVSKAGDTMSGILDMGANTIANVAAPVNDADAANKAYVDGAADTSYQEVYWVSTVDGNDDNDGSFSKPFKTIQKAVDTAPNDADAVINVMQTITEPDLTISKSKITIRGIGGFDCQAVLLYSRVVIEGAATTRVRFKDIQIRTYGLTGGGVPVTINGTAGRHKFDNVCFYPANGFHAFDITGSIPANFWSEFIDCVPMGIVDYGGTLAGAATFTLRQCSDAGMKINVASPWLVVLADIQRMGKLTHSAGAVVMRNVHSITADGGVCIESTAPLAAGNALFISAANLQQADMTYGTINKSGTCGWAIDNCNRDVASDELNGPRLNYTAFADDIAGRFAPVNYTNAGNDSIRGQIAGIDTKLGTLGGGVDNAIKKTDAFGGDVDGTYDNLQIKADAVDTTEIKDGAVTDAKLAEDYLKLSGGTMAGDLNMDGKDIRGVDELHVANLFATKENVIDIIVSNYALITTNLVMNGAVNMANNRILNLAAPVDDADAANKAYVDSKSAAGTKLTSIIWVAKNGNDETADGSVAKPYLTIAVAASAAATSPRSTILVAPGTYGESVTLPDNVSLFGSGNSTVIDGSIATTAGSPISLGDFNTTGLITFNTSVRMNNVASGGLIISSGASTSQAINSHVFRNNDDGPAISIVSGKLNLLLSTVYSTGDQPAVLQSGGGLIANQVEFRSSREAGYTVESSGGTFNAGFSQILNLGGGGAASLDNGATAPALNSLADVAAYGSIDCGTASTYVGQLQFLAGSLSGTAITYGPAKQVGYSNATSGLAATQVQDAIDELSGKTGDASLQNAYVKGNTIQKTAADRNVVIKDETGATIAIF